MLSHNDVVANRLLEIGRLVVDSDTGIVYAPRSNTPRRAAGSLTRKGYLRICVNMGQKRVWLMAHRVVCISIHGLPENSNWQVDHINGIKTDNRPINLQWVPHSENMDRARRRGVFRMSGWRNAPRDDFGRFIGKKPAGRTLDGRTWEETP